MLSQIYPVLLGLGDVERQSMTAERLCPCWTAP